MFLWTGSPTVFEPVEGGVDNAGGYSSFHATSIARMFWLVEGDFLVCSGLAVGEGGGTMCVHTSLPPEEVWDFDRPRWGNTGRFLFGMYFSTAVRAVRCLSAMTLAHLLLPGEIALALRPCLRAPSLSCPSPHSAAFCQSAGTAQPQTGQGRRR